MAMWCHWKSISLEYIVHKRDPLFPIGMTMNAHTHTHMHMYTQAYTYPYTFFTSQSLCILCYYSVGLWYCPENFVVWVNQNSTHVQYIGRHPIREAETTWDISNIKKLKQEIGYTGAGIGERLIKEQWGNLEFRLRRQPQPPLFLKEQKDQVALLELGVRDKLVKGETE